METTGITQPTKESPLTMEQFKALPDDKIFATGEIANSPEGIFMTRDGGTLRWVAKKGQFNDWAVYVHWSNHDEDWIRQHGDKVYDTNHIQKVVPCTSEVMGRYRY